MLFGYMRVSSTDDRQSVDLQRDVLVAAGVEAHVPCHTILPTPSTPHVAIPACDTSNPTKCSCTMTASAHRAVLRCRVQQAKRSRRRPRHVLWRDPFSRAMAWRRVKQVLAAAGIKGAQASPEGLRHAMGVAAVGRDIPLNMAQRWLGHAQLTTTATYAEVLGEGERRRRSDVDALMPIHPEPPWRYPIDWPELSHAIRFGQAGERCEGCGRLHKQSVTRLPHGCWLVASATINPRAMTVNSSQPSSWTQRGV